MVQLEDLPLKGKTVLVRVDFNVPLTEIGKISDTSRIDAALPTLQYLKNLNCKIVIMSHMGRPKGVDPALSLAVCAQALSEKMSCPVKMAPDSVGPEVVQMVKNLKPGEILLLENLRFYPAEEKPEKDPAFAERLAALGDFYVDDAFGCAHRAHASIVGVPALMKGRSAAGFLLRKECEALGRLVSNPEHPFLALIGGAKVSGKLQVLKSLLNKVDVFAIGGGMAFTFLKAQGFAVGASLVEDDLIEEAKLFIQACQAKGAKLLLPVDFLVGTSIQSAEKPQLFTLREEIPAGLMGLDIGPSTIQLFTEAMKGAKTIFWNGPMGVFESPLYAQGTFALAEAFTKSNAFTVAGGGETVSALNQSVGRERISHLSTGGGASLEFIESGSLPGVSVLTS